MRWQCSFHDSRGSRCEKPATIRIHFAKDHPFDHMDLCEEHLDFHPGYCWSQELEKEILDSAEVLP